MADILGWSKRRMLRFLRRQEETVGIRCLWIVGNTHVTTLAAIREIMPEFGEKLVSAPDMQRVVDEMARQRRELQTTARALLALDRKSETRMRTLETRVGSLEAHIGAGGPDRTIMRPQLAPK